MVFPSLFNLSLNLAIRSSWLEPQSAPGLVFTDYIVSSCSAAKNTINLISVLTIWWCPCVESSFVLLEEGVCYDQCILLAKLLAFALLHFVLQGQTCLLLQICFEFLPLHSSSLSWKGHLFFMLVLENLLRHCKTIQLQLLKHYCWGIDLDYSDIEWLALEVNRNHSVILETAP